MRGWSSLVWSADFKSVGDEKCSVVRFHLLRVDYNVSNIKCFLFFCFFSKINVNLERKKEEKKRDVISNFWRGKDEHI